MQAIISAMREDGFNPESVEASGKVIRFKRDDKDRKRNAWYICFLNHTRKGDAFYVCVYGDWRDQGNEYTFCSLTKKSREDQKFIEKQIEDAQRKRDEEQKKVWEETALEAASVWSALEFTGTSEYLTRKKVDAFRVRFEKGVLYIPLVDEDEKLWSLQKIYPDGTKLFMEGGRVKGNFHLIGSGIGKEMLVCEGYATAASLHQATGLPVLVCFNASNLPEVCRKFPDAQLTVCPDDDIFTPEGKGGNAGRKWAAKCAASRVIFPRFKNFDGKPTDFNDLHTREGLDEVKRQITNSDAEKSYVTPLGHKDVFYYYISSSNKQIVRIPREGHNKNTLRDLMPDQFWAALYPKAKGEGVDWDAAADSLMMKCRKRGIFDDDMVRGVGVWKDGNRYLINLGDSLYCDGNRYNLDAFKSEYIYEIGKRIEPPLLAPLQAHETKPLIDILKNISFASPDHYKFLGGWLVVAPLGGALEWRPHVWITGASNTGKTTIGRDVVQKFTRRYAHILLGATTEAGVRQTVKSDSKAVIFDEFETDDEQSGFRVGHVLELMRQASSETEGKVAKGSPSGQAVYYHPKFCALVSSIRVNLLHEADRTRFTVLELVRNGNPESYNKLRRALADLDKMFVDRFFSRNFRKLETLKLNIETFWEALRHDFSARVGQQYGTLLAGYWLIEHDEPVTLAEAKKFVEESKLHDARQVAEEREERECFEYLIKRVIRVISGSGHVCEKSIIEMIRAVSGHQQGEADEAEDSAVVADNSFNEPLQRYGIKVRDREIFIAKKHPELAKIFKYTKWAGGWGKSLARLPNAKPDMNTRILGNQTKCVVISLGEIFDEVPF